MLLLQDLAASPSAPRTDKQERNIPKPWKYILAELKIFFFKINQTKIWPHLVYWRVWHLQQERNTVGLG